MIALEEGRLRKMWPRAPLKTIKAIASTSAETFQTTGINTPLRVAHFMAQISHECGAGTIVRENMSYSAKRMMEIFGVGRHSAKVTAAEATALAGKPQLIAERVYGLGNPSKAKELGNTQPGDGFKYRGNGMLQLTGRGSHKRVGDETGFDLEDRPEQLEDPARSFLVAATEFVALRCLPAADADDVALVTRRVNGGRNGLPERTVWLRRWKECLDGVEEPARRPRAAPQAEEKPLMESKIAQGTVATGGLTLLGTGAQVASYVQNASDTVSTTKDTADNVITVVSTVRPILGFITPGMLVGVAVGCAIAALAGCGYVLWKRYRKLQDQGV